MAVTKNRKDRRLGIAQEKRRYDLPLNKDEGARFLILLVALMTFLATMSLAFSLSLGGMVSRWSSGLENKITIEIAAEDEKEKIRSSKDVELLSKKVVEVLQGNKALHSIEILDEDHIGDLLEPWLGADFTENAALSDIPIPGMISAEIHDKAEVDFTAIEEELFKIAANIHVDRHEEWLGDLTRFAGSLQLSSIIVVLVIIFTTIVAVAGAIRSRMAEYSDDVELLHLMGARDDYITKQFQRHARLIGVQGGLFGIGLSLLAIIALAFIMDQGGDSALPNLSLQVFDFVILFCVPVIMSIVTSVGSRYTVMRVLSRMP